MSLELDDRLRSQGPHAVSGSDQNDGAVHIVSPHHVSDMFPGSAQTTFDAEKREDSELLDNPLRSQGSLDTLVGPQKHWRERPESRRFNPGESFNLSTSRF